MIAYFDTSAFVPLLIAEKPSERCAVLWNETTTVVATRLLYVEAAAALAMGQRRGRIDDAQHGGALDLLEELWNQIRVIELDVALMRRAGQLAREHRLRGFDAAHCAAAELIADKEVVAASGHRQLLDAWREMGLATFDVAG